MDTVVADNARADEMDDVEEKKKNKRRMVFAVIGIIIISIVMATYIYNKYGTVHLKPGEKYTVNIPFIGPSKNPVISGIAAYTNGTPVKNITVIVKYKGNNTILAQNTTGNDGKYIIYLPEIEKGKSYDVYVGYNNSTLTLGSNDYTLNLGTNKKKYSKGEIVVINGTIENKDAEIENGRVLVSLAYCNGTLIGTSCKGTPGKWKYLYKDERYSLDIGKGRSIDIPYDEFNVTFDTTNASVGGYKFVLDFSFNAKEKERKLYFNVTA